MSPNQVICKVLCIFSSLLLEVLQLVYNKIGLFQTLVAANHDALFGGLGKISCAYFYVG